MVSMGGKCRNRAPWNDTLFEFGTHSFYQCKYDGDVDGDGNGDGTCKRTIRSEKLAGITLLTNIGSDLSTEIDEYE